MGRPKKDAAGKDESTEQGSPKIPKKEILKTASSERPNRRALAEMNKPRSLRNSVSTDSPPTKTKTSTPKRKKGIAYVQKGPRKRRALGKTDSASEDDDGAAQNTTPEVRVNNKAEASKSSNTDQHDVEMEEAEGPHYWLMKAEPESRIEKGKDVKFSIDDLKAATEPEAWDGVRNYAARNNMCAMMKGDQAFFYHSNCKVPGIAGTMEIVEEHSIDESAFDAEHPYYDEKATREKPKWCVVRVAFRQKFANLIKLKELQSFAKEGGALENMQVLKTTRLSVSRVRKSEWDFIMSLVEPEEQTESSKPEQVGAESAEAKEKKES